MEHYGRQHQQNLNAVEALLARYWPEATEVMELGSVTLLTVLSVHGDPSEVASQPKKAQALMRQASRNAMAEQKRSELLRSAQETIGVPLLPEERSLVRDLAHDALRSHRAKEQAKARIRELSRDTSEVAAMGAVVGLVTAAVLATKVGNPSVFDSARAFEKSIGLNLREHSSGQHKGGLKITKRGSGLARKYLYLAALRLLNTDPIVQSWYQKKVARDGGKKMKAVVAVMRKLIRALWHVGRGEPFDSTKLFDVSRLGILAVAS